MVRIAQTLWKIFARIPEYFLLLLALLCSPFFPLIPPFLVFGGLYVFHTYRHLQQKNVPAFVTASVYAYYVFLFFLTLFLLKVDLFLSRIPVLFFICCMAYISKQKKLSSHLIFILFLAFTGVLLTLTRGSEQHNSTSYRKAMHNEKYAKLIITADTNLPASAFLNRVIKTNFISVRNIFIDENEKFLYFTANPPDQNYNSIYPALFKVSLEDPSNFSMIHYYFCSNFVYDEKRKQFYLPVRARPEILVVDPDAFKIKKHISVPAPHNAGDFFLDKKNDRLIAIPEAGRAWLYDLQHNAYTETSMGLYFYSAGVLNNGEHQLYTISYLGAYLLKEYDTNTLLCTRKIFSFFEPSWSLSYDSVRKLFYVAGFFSGKIHIVSQPDFKEMKTFLIKPGIRPIAVDSQRNVLYAGNHMDDYMYVLNFDGKILGKVFVGKRCRSIVLSPRTRRLFVGTSAGILEINIDAFLKHWRESLDKRKQTK